MGYIGPEPKLGRNREVDDISSGFNGSATAFTLQVGGDNVSPGTANDIIVSLGGVVQNPSTDYTIAGSTLTFTTAPASSLSFFAVVLGQGIDSDVNTPSDGSVTTAKLANGAVTGPKLAKPIDLADDEKIRFGTGNDLEIYHDGIQNFIKSNNGSILLRHVSDSAIETFTNGQVNLYHDNNLRFETKSGGIALTGGAAANITSVTQSSGTITFDFALSCHHKVTLTQNATLGAPSNQAVGQSGSLFITQPSSGNYTVAYNSAFKFAGGTTPTASTSSNAVDRIDYIVLSSNHVHAVMSLDVKTGT